MKPTIISIIGAPGVGKTFLTKKLAEYLHAEVILEKDNEIPKRVIESLENNIRPIETVLWFRNKLIKNIGRAISMKRSGKTVIMDSCLITNELHIKIMTPGYERKILLEQADLDKKYIPNPDVIIFLNASAKTIKNFTLKRGRSFDTSKTYLKRNQLIRRTHQEYYKKNKDSMIYINRDKLDFNKKDDLIKVINKVIKN